MPHTHNKAGHNRATSRAGLATLRSARLCRRRYSASEICFRLEADIDGIGIQTVGWTIK